MAIQLPGPMILILKKYMPDEVILKKVTVTEDTEWGQPTYSTVDYTVRASTFPITLEDVSFMPPGLIAEGDIYLMLLGSYEQGGQTIIPEVGDRIQIEAVIYEIRIMSAILHGDVVVTRTGYAKRLNI